MSLPTILWSRPNGLISRTSGKLSFMSVSIRPPTYKVIAEWIHKHKWKQLIFMQDGDAAAINLELIYQHFDKLNGVRYMDYQVIVKSEIIVLPDDASRFADFVSEFHRVRFNTTENSFHIIVHMSNRQRQKKFLSALENVSIQSPDRFHYVMADFGVTPRDIALMRQRFLNVTAFQLVDRETENFRRFRQIYYDIHMQNKQRRRDSAYYDNDDDFVLDDILEHEEITTDACLVYDTLVVMANALGKYLTNVGIKLISEMFNGTHFMNGGHPGMYCVPSHDRLNPTRPFLPFVHGEKIADIMRNGIISEDHALTGTIQFDEFGLRTNYTIQIYDMTYKTGSSWATEKTYIWNEKLGIVSEKLRSGGTDYSEGKKLIATTLLVTPFAFRPTEKDPIIGYSIDLTDKIAKILGMKYEIRVVKDGHYGNADFRGEWDGMIGEIIRKEADMAVAPLVINRQRERVVDFSKPFITTGISIMIKKPDKQDLSVFSFMQPLSRNVWIYIILSYFGVVTTISVVAKITPSEYRVMACNKPELCLHNPFNLYNTLFYALAAATQQSSDIHPRSIASRIVSSTWWFFCLILIASYTANLAAFLTSEKITKPIDSVDQLAGQSRIKYGLLANGSTEQFFRTTTVPLYNKMWQRMQRNRKEVLVDSYIAGIRKVRDSKGAFAFLMEATANEYEATQLPCDTVKTGELLNSVGYGVATPFGSPYRQRISLAILMLQEAGELKRLENKWWHDRSQCENSDVENLTVSLNLSKVAGIFYLLMSSMVVAMAVTVCELVYEFLSQSEQTSIVRLQMPGMVCCIVKPSTLALSAVAVHLLPAKVPTTEKTLQLTQTQSTLTDTTPDRPTKDIEHFGNVLERKSLCRAFGADDNSPKDIEHFGNVLDRKSLCRAFGAEDESGSHDETTPM